VTLSLARALEDEQLSQGAHSAHVLLVQVLEASLQEVLAKRLHTGTEALAAATARSSCQEHQQEKGVQAECAAQEPASLSLPQPPEGPAPEAVGETGPPSSASAGGNGAGPVAADSAQHDASGTAARHVGHISRADVPPELRAYYDAVQSIALDAVRTDFSKQLPRSASNASGTGERSAASSLSLSLSGLGVTGLGGSAGGAGKPGVRGPSGGTPSAAADASWLPASAVTSPTAAGLLSPLGAPALGPDAASGQAQALQLPPRAARSSVDGAAAAGLGADDASRPALPEAGDAAVAGWPSSSGIADRFAGWLRESVDKAKVRFSRAASESGEVAEQPAPPAAAAPAAGAPAASAHHQHQHQHQHHQQHISTAASVLTAAPLPAALAASDLDEAAGAARLPPSACRTSVATAAAADGAAQPAPAATELPPLQPHPAQPAQAASEPALAAPSVAAEELPEQLLLAPAPPQQHPGLPPPGPSAPAGGWIALALGRLEGSSVLQAVRRTLRTSGEGPRPDLGQEGPMEPAGEGGGGGQGLAGSALAPQTVEGAQPEPVHPAACAEPGPAGEAVSAAAEPGGEAQQLLRLEAAGESEKPPASSDETAVAAVAAALAGAAMPSSPAPAATPLKTAGDTSRDPDASPPLPPLTVSESPVLDAAPPPDAAPGRGAPPSPRALGSAPRAAETRTPRAPGVPPAAAASGGGACSAAGTSGGHTSLRDSSAKVSVSVSASASASEDSPASWLSRSALDAASPAHARCGSPRPAPSP
jgi:hypothetical protein